MTYNKYISTTLPYANSIPHIGHALEFIQASALVRYLKNTRKESVYFNIGVDEHGSKIYDAAQKLGFDTKEYLELSAISWKNFAHTFEIDADNFYRTTDLKHHQKVQSFWTKCLERGDLYKSQYKAKYCKGCESKINDSDLVDGKCPHHGTEPDLVDEENWFFRVSKYRDDLIKWLEANPDFLSPQAKTEELKNLILNAEDISVSRLKTSVSWGVAVPGDPDQTIYVWFDALLNYIFAVDNFSNQEFIQICGPDNLRFQGCLFQAILESASLSHTKKLLVHGTILDSEGRKMSKTLCNVIDPIDQFTKYGLDAVRYYTLAGLTTYGNACWSEEDLVKTYNSELADDFGNLISRTLHLIDTKNVETDIPYSFHLDPFGKEVLSLLTKSCEAWDKYEINQGIKEINNILKLSNKYINDNAPWKEEDGYKIVLNNLIFTLGLVNEALFPVLSIETHNKITEALRNKKKVIIFKKLEYGNS